MRKLALLMLALSLEPSVAHSQTEKLMLFGGRGHDVYLGCLNCGDHGVDSLCNSYGKYGNSFSTDSIFNEYSSFGNEFATASPWNEFSSSNDVPVLVDAEGDFYGYFTINEYRHNAVDFATDLNEIYDAADGDLELVQGALCEAF